MSQGSQQICPRSVWSLALASGALVTNAAARMPRPRRACIYLSTSWATVLGSSAEVSTATSCSNKLALVMKRTLEYGAPLWPSKDSPLVAACRRLRHHLDVVPRV